MRNRIRTAGALALVMLFTGPTLAQTGEEGYLGVHLTRLSVATRTALGLEKREGILIERVVEGQAADKGGLAAGDVLLALGGHSVHSSVSLARALDRAGAGETVKVTILRAGKRESMEVTLGDRSRRGRPVWAPEAIDWGTFVLPSVPELPEAPVIAVPEIRSLWGLGDSSQRLGLRTTELTGQLAEYFDVARGLLVIWVVPDSPAGRADVKAGDILISLGGQPIGRREDLSFILRPQGKEDQIALEVVRRGQKTSLKLEF